MTEAQRENPSRRLRVFTQSPAEFFGEGLRQIEKTRMAGLPILNPKLVVRSAGWRRWGNDWIGVVTTPWAVLGIYACGSREGWVDVPADRTRIIELPAGDFPFRAVEDPILGRCLFLSLKSPLLDVGDQETADLIGKITLDTLFKAQSIPEDDEDAAAWVPPTSDGQLRRVIPIRMTPPKNIEATPPLTPTNPSLNLNLSPLSANPSSISSKNPYRAANSSAAAKKRSRRMMRPALMQRPSSAQTRRMPTTVRAIRFAQRLTRRASNHDH